MCSWESFQRSYRCTRVLKREPISLFPKENQEKDEQSESEFEFHCVQRHVEEQVTGDLWMGEMVNDIQFYLDYMFTSFRLWNGLLKVEL